MYNYFKLCLIKMTTQQYNKIYHELCDDIDKYPVIQQYAKNMTEKQFVDNMMNVTSIINIVNAANCIIDCKNNEKCIDKCENKFLK